MIAGQTIVGRRHRRFGDLASPLDAAMSSCAAQVRGSAGTAFYVGPSVADSMLRRHDDRAEKTACASNTIANAPSNARRESDV